MEKKILIKLQIIIGTMVALLALVFVLNFFIQKKAGQQIGEQIQMLLNNKSPDTYTVTGQVTLDSTTPAIGKCYTIKNKNLKEDSYATTIKLMGFSGPVTALFFTEKDYTTFIDFMGLKNTRNYSNNGINESQLSYWQHAIDSFILSNNFNGGKTNAEN